jgi:hypothetical protein
LALYNFRCLHPYLFSPRPRLGPLARELRFPSKLELFDDACLGCKHRNLEILELLDSHLHILKRRGKDWRLGDSRT